MNNDGTPTFDPDEDAFRAGWDMAREALMEHDATAEALLREAEKARDRAYMALIDVRTMGPTPYFGNHTPEDTIIASLSYQIGAVMFCQQYLEGAWAMSLLATARAML